MRTLFSAAVLAAIVTISPDAAPPVFADTSVTQTSTGTFVRKQKSIKGDWHIEQRGDQNVIVFGDSFRAARGPDLKVFLSPQSIAEVTGKTATNDAALISELQKTKGAQEYIIPADVDLSKFTSVLIHCEAYSVCGAGRTFDSAKPGALDQLTTRTVLISA